MRIIFSSCRVAAAFIAFIAIVAGCAIPGPVRPTAEIVPPSPEVASEKGWWFAQFRMHWPAEKPADWHWDLFIADKIVGPVLVQYKDEILLWRFHRRAVRDGAGHQFSFIFYASAESAHQILNALRDNELLTEMKDAGAMIEDFYDHPDKIERPRIEDTSDASWPLSIQRNWPYFIMGASQMWLNLISDTVAKVSNSARPLSLQEHEHLYKKVNAGMNTLWEKEGQHAFLHHLNGLFGYQPIIFYEKRMLKF